jgi:hypothetical protein
MMIKIDEKHLEDIVFESLETEEGCKKLYERGLGVNYSLNQTHIRQLRLNEYGIPDIVSIRFEGGTIDITITELKVVEFNISHLLQVGRYIAGVNHLLKQAPALHARKGRVRGVLIVSDYFSDNDYSWISEIMSASISIYKVDYRLDGLYFTRVAPLSWHLKQFTGDVKNLISQDLIDHYIRSYKSYLATQGNDDLG